MDANSQGNAVMQRLRRRNAMLLKALNQTIWHERAQFPGDPFCILCGVGKKWSSTHGHQRKCAIYKGITP